MWVGDFSRSKINDLELVELWPLHLNLPLRSPHECLVGTKRGVCERVEPSPLTLALSPNPRNVLGEREDIVETLTQGDARGSCLALALGYNPRPRWGSTWKKRPPAASQMSKLQVQASSLLRSDARLPRRNKTV